MNRLGPRCAGLTDLFDSRHPHDHARARVLCASCLLARECLEEALRQARARGNGYVPDGTWGGLLWRDGSVITR